MQDFAETTSEMNAETAAASEAPKSPKSGKGNAKSANQKETERKPVATKQAFMYLGPNIPGGLLFNGALHKKMPEHLSDLFDKLPEVEKLFVEVKKVPAFKRDLDEPGSEAYRLYQSTVASLRKGALKDGV